MRGIFSAIRKSLGIVEPVVVPRSIAKERLSIMLVHQRNSEFLAQVDMEAMRKEVAEVVQKYIKVAEEKANITVRHEGDFDLLEMHFPLVGRKI